MALSEKTLSVLLFSGFICLNYAKVLSSKHWMLARSLADTRDNKSLLRGSNGNKQGLVVIGSSECCSNEWRKIKSVDVDSENGSDQECELEIINDLDEPVLLCWITNKGELKHYHPIADSSIKDGSVHNSCLEYTQAGHAFVCLRNSKQLPKFLKEVTNDILLFCYTPSAPKQKSIITLSMQKKRRFPSFTFNSNNNNIHNIEVNLELQPLSHEDSIIIDTTQKPYLTKVIHGFTVHYEEEVFTTVEGMEETLGSDLAEVSRLLPPVALRQLQNTTPLWVNKAITYGTTKEPVEGRSATFHPLGGRDWLRKNGLREEKEGSVEIFNGPSYLKSRGNWGVGGVLVHEYSHAYHNKFCPDGYDCEEIRQAYNNAMDKKLYEQCAVHGPQGVSGPQKAYACWNCMEFWAELSVAYHWTADDCTEYNKWFPFNRAQLRQHDEASYQVLNKLWHVLTVEGNEI